MRNSIYFRHVVTIAFVLTTSFLAAADLTVTESEKAEFLKLPTKYNPKTISVEKCSAILSSSPGTNAALEAKAHLLAHEIYTQKATDIQVSMRSLYQQYGSLSSMPRAVKIIASAYEVKKDYAAVIPLYTEAINALKDKGEYGLKGSLVRAYFETGQNDKADAVVNEVLAKCLADKKAGPLKLFLSPFNTDKTLPAAVRVYSEAQKAWGTFDLPCGIRSQLAEAYIQLREYDKAIQLARIIIEQDINEPGNIPNINTIARHMSKSGNREEAVRMYQAVIGKYPDHPQTYKAYEGVIVSLLDMGKKKEAAQLVEEYTAKYVGKPQYMSPDGEQPEFLPSAQRIVERLERRGLMDEALTLGERLNAGQSVPTMESIKTLAVTRIKAGQLDEAAKLTNTMLKDYPMDEAKAMAVVEVAAALRETGQLDKAMGLYEYARGISKGTRAKALAIAGRAQIWAKQGKDEAVKAEVDKIVTDAQNQPDVGLTVFVIGEQYYFMADEAVKANDPNQVKANYQKALAVWQRFEKAVPNHNSPLCAYYSGIVCQRLGQYEQALSHFQRVIAQWPQFDRAWFAQYQIALIYEKNMKQGIVTADKVKQIYQALLEKYPNCSVAQIAAEKLGNL
jgi:tetratricopeptide (TPR) repeat protein